MLIPVLAYQPFGFRDNEGRFLSFVIGLPNLHQVSLGIVGEQVLLDALAIYRDEILGGVQDIRRRPVILVQSDGLGLRVVTLEAEYVAYVGATPGVDRLVGVAHHADVLVGLSQEPGQLVLGDVGVLKLVHHDVFVAVVVLRPDAGELPKELYCLHQKVVEVHSVVAGQGLFVVVVDLGADLLEVVVGVLGEGPGVPHLVLCVGDYAEDGPGRVPLGVDLRQFHGVLDDLGLVVGVVDRVVGVQAKVVPVDTQHLGAEGVERAYGQRVAAGADQPVQPFPHLPGGLVGEGHGQNVEGADLVLSDQVGDAVSDDPGLAAAGPGHDEERAIDGLDGLFLRWVKSFQ